MSYTGPGSVVSTVDEFLTHWAGVDDALDPAVLSVVVPGTSAAKTRADLVTLRTLYNAVQSAPGSGPAAAPPAPQFPSVQALRNNEETARAGAAAGRESVAEAIGAFNRKVRGSLGHTSFPNSLPDAPRGNDGNAAIIAAGDDMISVWTNINALVAGPLFTPPLLVSVLPAGTSTPVTLSLAQATTRLTALKNSVQEVLNAENGLQTMRPYRDGIWENEIRPILVAYGARVRGEFPEGSAFVESLPNLYPGTGHTPDAVNATGAWNTGTNEADYAWSLSTDPELLRYEVRMSPGPSYDSDASSVIGTIPAGNPLTFSTDEGLTTPGQTSSVKVYVVLTTGNEKGSNTVTITRPV